MFAVIVFIATDQNWVLKTVDVTNDSTGVLWHLIAIRFSMCGCSGSPLLKKNNQHIQSCYLIFKGVLFRHVRRNTMSRFYSIRVFKSVLKWKSNAINYIMNNDSFFLCRHRRPNNYNTLNSRNWREQLIRSSLEVSGQTFAT